LTSLVAGIPSVREAVGAIFRMRRTRAETIKKGKPRPAQFQCGWGSAVCVVADKYFLTAFHVLNGGEPRDPGDKFYALVVPGNGNPFFFFPIVAFPLERPDVDLAVVEIGPCANGAVHVPALSVTFAPQPDGTRVLTLGFPAPEIGGLNADPQGNFLGGQFFLKSHANEGIVSAQYILGANSAYELNVGWHHGESGGPIVRLDDEPAVFALMQHYRNTQGPHGILPGPHRGFALSAIAADLQALGISAV
jgi:Trypsin-like peptidase domain